MIRATSLWLLWGGFILYAFLFAPPDQPDTFTLIQQLSTGQWSGINPLVVALFNLMGIWPMIYAAVLLSDGQGQTIRAWPFVGLSFGLGAFALLPYLALRSPHRDFTGSKTRLLSLVESRWLGWAIALGTVVLLSYGILQGNWGDFVAQWKSSRFIHVMSLDFCLLSGLFGVVLGDDMARRGWGDRRWFWVASLVPMLGAAFYLALRPPLQPTTTTPTETAFPVKG
jgi:hypothetical protein